MLRVPVFARIATGRSIDAAGSATNTSMVAIIGFKTRLRTGCVGFPQSQLRAVPPTSPNGQLLKFTAGSFAARQDIIAAILERPVSQARGTG